MRDWRGGRRFPGLPRPKRNPDRAEHQVSSISGKGSRALPWLWIGFWIALPSFTPSMLRGAATIVVQSGDAAGVGLNDTTPANPVGGNSGTTLGQQRLIALQAAANKWGATLDSVPT